MIPSKHTIWSTPQKLFDKLDAEFKFERDVCADADNAKCAEFFLRDEAMGKRWSGRCFLNPPFGREISYWVSRAYLAGVDGGATVVCLVPTRTNAPWWHEVALLADEMRFIRKKLPFVSNNGKKGVPFTGHAVLVFDGHRRSKTPIVSSMEQQ